MEKIFLRFYSFQRETRGHLVVNPFDRDDQSFHGKLFRQRTKELLASREEFTLGDLSMLSSISIFENLFIR